tara:strand:- start:22264 stop:23295 length:1032 start_codon:yes stop_codon:yes gene_type:complete
MKKLNPNQSDPISYFIEDMEYHGRSKRTRDAYYRVLINFQSFLNEKCQTTIANATQRDCMAWIHGVRQISSPSTIATYASYINRFYRYMSNVGLLNANPMLLVVEELTESIEPNPIRRDISLKSMQEFLKNVSHPLDRAIIITLLKTGMRVGELCNLDLRDLNLADVDVSSTYSVKPRGAIGDRPGTLYISKDPARGEIYNEELRTASNKRKRSTMVPIDAELHHNLKVWLSVRPDALSPAQPVFLSTAKWGCRITPSIVRSRLLRYTKNTGWHVPGAGAEENVTPHYFRHFFTTNLRNETGDRGVVKYLRGDVADDIIETYTHNWGDRVRSVYEKNIYSLLI